MNKVLILFIALLITGGIQGKTERVCEHDNRGDFSRE